MINQKKRDAIIRLFKRILIEDGVNPVKRDKLFKSGIYLVDEAINYLTANDSNTLVSQYVINISIKLINRHCIDLLKLSILWT